MSLAAELELIRQVPIFSGIDPSQQKLLCIFSERVVYAPGEVMFREGDAADAAYLVIDGAVEISIDTPGGRRVVNRLGPNDMVGEAAVFADMPRTATATALSRVEVLRLVKDLFHELARNNAQIAMQLNRILAQRLANTTAQLASLARAA